MKRIILVGYMGAGKTTVGKALAKDLGVFENNESARRCYEAVGFTAYSTRECVMPIGTWRCTDMEIDLER